MMLTVRQSIAARIRALMRPESEGGALVELSLTLPIVFLLMTGIFAFSIALYQKLELAEAVSAGGRTLAVDRGDTDPCKTTASAIYAAAPTLTQSSISLTFVLNGVSTTGASCPGVLGTANANMVSGSSAEVEASYPCMIKMYGLKFSNCSLGSEVTEMVQ